MSADDFFSRWSRRKQEPAQDGKPEAAPAGPDAPVSPVAPAEPLPPPTLDDVAALNHDADFRRFVAPGVDETVRRSAMKKLFTDPHFNVMDGLDIYIDDYNKFEPLPAAMLAMLQHAKPLLDPLGHLKQPVMNMLDLAPAQAEQGAQAHAEPAPAEAEVEGNLDAPQDGRESAFDASPQPVAAASDASAEAPVDEAPAPTPQDPEAPKDDHSI